MTLLTSHPMDRFEVDVNPRSGNIRDTFFEIVIDTLDNIKEYASEVRDDLAPIADGEMTQDTMMVDSDDLISIQAAASAVTSKEAVSEPFKTNSAADMALWHISERHRYIIDIDRVHIGKLDFLDYIDLLQRHSVRSPLSRVLGQVPSVLTIESLQALGVDSSDYDIGSDHLVVVIPFFSRLS